MQEPSYLSKIVLISIWNRVVLTHIINLGIRIFSRLDILTKCQCLSGTTILIPTSKFFDNLTDVDY
jgi:hypothetical protein